MLQTHRCQTGPDGGRAGERTGCEGEGEEGEEEENEADISVCHLHQLMFSVAGGTDTNVWSAEERSVVEENVEEGGEQGGRS